MSMSTFRGIRWSHDLSDEVLCARWLENPYYQFFCGELSFCHQLPFDRSSTDALAPAAGRGAAGRAAPGEPVGGAQDRRLGDQDLERVVVDTTVQPKAIAHPTDARLMPSGAGEAGRSRQAQRCAAAAELSAGGQAGRDHGRALYPRAPVQARPARSSNSCASRLGAGDPRHPPQDRWRRGAGSALRPACSPWRSGCASRISASAGQRSMRCTPRRSSASARAKPGRPTSSAARSVSRPRRRHPGAASSCCMPRRCTAIQEPALDGHDPRDGYARPGDRRSGEADRRGDPPHPRRQGAIAATTTRSRFRVWISGQVRRVTASIRREMKRRAAVEPVIGHLKAEHRMAGLYRRLRLREIVSGLWDLVRRGPASVSGIRFALCQAPVSPDGGAGGRRG